MKIRPTQKSSETNLASLEGSESQSLLIPVCILLILISFLAHLGYLSRAGFTNGDEPWLDLNAAAVRSHGAPAYFAQAGNLANIQGRVQYYFTWWLFLAPHFIDSDWKRALLNGIIHLLSLASLSWFLAYYSGKRDAWLLLALFYCLLPYARLYWPLASFPFVYSLSILLFFGGFGLYLRLRTHPRSQWGFTGKLIALTAVWLSLFIYESQTLCFGIIALACLWRETQTQHAVPQRLKAMARNDWPVFTVIVLFAAIYAGYRLSHGSSYDGTSISRASATNVKAVWNVVYLFATTGLPAANFFQRLDGLSAFWVGHLRLGELSVFISSNLGMTGFLKALLGGVAVCLMGSKRAERVADQLAGAGAAIPLTALVLGFLIQVPPALTGKYQQTAAAWAPYLSGYLSFLCFVVCIWGVLRSFARLAERRFPRFAWTAMVIPAAAVFLCAALNAIANQGVARQQEQHYVKWKLMAGFQRTGAFLEIPSNAVVVAPTLWDGVYDVTWETLDQYWTHYVAAHTGRNIQMVRRTPADGEALAAAGRLYAAQVQWTFDSENALLLVSRIAMSANGRYISDRLLLIGDRDYKNAALSMRTVETAAGARQGEGAGTLQSGGGLLHLPLPPFRFEGGAYLSEVQLPGMIAGTWRIISGKLTPGFLHAFEVVGRQGFSPLSVEGDGRVIQWSDGANGTGVTDLVNTTNTPREALFSTRVLTGTDQPTRFELVIQGKTETILLRHNEWIARVITLLPGDNELHWHSYGSRIAAPGDPRYIVFGLADFSIQPAGLE